MSISEQVKELEQRAINAEDTLVGLRAGMMGKELPESEKETTYSADARREGARLRRIARMDLEGFRAGVLGETYGAGSDPEFVRGYEEGRKAVAALTKAAADEVETPTSPEEGGHYLVHRVPGYDRPVHVYIDRGNVWGYSVYKNDAAYRTIGCRLLDWMKPGMGWEKEEALPEGTVWPIGPCIRCSEPVFDSVRQGPGVVLDFRGPHTCITNAVETPSPIRVGGNPPAPEIGMIATYLGGASGLVACLPWRWPTDILEIRAPWGGPVVWRRE